MRAEFSQDTRLAKLHTALPKDTLVLRRFGGEEMMNGLFEFRVEALSAKADLNFDEILGTHATVEIDTISQGPRFFDGIVTQARWVGPGRNGFQYELVLQPWFWVAGKRRQQRIFHEKSIPDIIEEVLRPYSSLGKLENLLEETYDPHEYVVQYNESDLAFTRRLMEKAGINFHFTFDMQEHKLVLTDTVDQLEDIPGAQRKYLGNDSRVHGEDEHFWSWHSERNFVTGAVRLTDFNFKTPDAMMEVDRMGDAAYAEGQLESYDYPGGYLDGGSGGKVAKLRLKQEQGADKRHRAIGDCLSLSAGMRCQITGQHTDAVDGKAFVCLKAQHFLESDAYGSGDGSGSGTSYTGKFTMVPDDSPVAPPRQTPTPVIVGPQTAMVVGEGEIDCDEFGRVLLLFAWDLAKANSMRVRSSQSWAHKGWGGITIPRIGMEVIVEFINGDPDQPIITGHVFNGKNKPPYDLPANKTRTSIKTKTHQGDGFNELRFEDELDKQEIFIHAEKNRNEKTKNSHTERIDNNWAQSVVNSKVIEVAKGHMETIGGNMQLIVGPSGLGKVVSQAHTAASEGISALADGLNDLFAAMAEQGNMEVVIDNNRSETIGANSKTLVGRNSQLLVGANRSVNVAGNISQVAVGTSTEVIGKSKKIMATDQIVLRSGKASITLKKDGSIILSGKDLKFVGSGKILHKSGSRYTVKSGGAVTVKGPKIDLN